jgi:hypothetical protein
MEHDAKWVDEAFSFRIYRAMDKSQVVTFYNLGAPGGWGQGGVPLPRHSRAALRGVQCPTRG